MSWKTRPGKNSTLINTSPPKISRNLKLYLVAADVRTFDLDGFDSVMGAAGIIASHAGQSCPADVVYFDFTGHVDSLTLYAVKLSEFWGVNSVPLEHKQLLVIPAYKFGKDVQLLNSFFINQAALSGHTSIVVVTNRDTVGLMTGNNGGILPGSVHLIDVETHGAGTSLGVRLSLSPDLP